MKEFNEELELEQDEEVEAAEDVVEPQGGDADKREQLCLLEVLALWRSMGKGWLSSPSTSPSSSSSSSSSSCSSTSTSTSTITSVLLCALLDTQDVLWRSMGEGWASAATCSLLIWEQTDDDDDEVEDADDEVDERAEDVEAVDESLKSRHWLMQVSSSCCD